MFQVDAVSLNSPPPLQEKSKRIYLTAKIFFYRRVIFFTDPLTCTGETVWMADTLTGILA
jgi:hypothetical protein